MNNAHQNEHKCEWKEWPCPEYIPNDIPSEVCAWHYMLQSARNLNMSAKDLLVEINRYKATTQ